MLRIFTSIVRCQDNFHLSKYEPDTHTRYTCSVHRRGKYGTRSGNYLVSLVGTYLVGSNKSVYISWGRGYNRLASVTPPSFTHSSTLKHVVRHPICRQNTHVLRSPCGLYRSHLPRRPSRCESEEKVQRERSERVLRSLSGCRE